MCHTIIWIYTLCKGFVTCFSSKRRPVERLPTKMRQQRNVDKLQENFTLGTSRGLFSVRSALKVWWEQGGFVLIIIKIMYIAFWLKKKAKPGMRARKKNMEWHRARNKAGSSKKTVYQMSEQQRICYRQYFCHWWRPVTRVSGFGCHIFADENASHKKFVIYIYAIKLSIFKLERNCANLVESRRWLHCFNIPIVNIVKKLADLVGHTDRFYW